MFNDFSFLYPYLLLLIIPFILAYKYFKNDRVSYYMPHFYDALAHANKKEYLKSLLKWLVLIFMLLALASPVIEKSVEDTQHKSIDIVLSLDTSGSMTITGFNPKKYEQSRWDIVREVTKDFIQKRKYDRIGLVVFASSTAVASPLSHDKQSQLDIIDSIKLGIVGKSTALIDGVVSAVSLLKKSKKSSKVIIVLSDGEDSASKIPLSVALKFAKIYGIKIYTITIDKSDSNMLKILSKKNDGKNFEANNKEDLYNVYKTINTLERTALETRQKILEPLAFYFLAIALGFAFLLLLLITPREKL